MVGNGVVALIGAMMVSGAAQADYSLLNMTQGVTPTSEAVYGLHMTIFYICCVIGVVVFGAMIYSMVKHRKSKGAVAANFHESTTAEVVWTIIPILILVGMAVPATRTLLAMEDTSNSDMTIKVTGIQWKWKYDYLEDDVSFVSNLHPQHNEIRQLGAGQDPAGIDNYLLEVDEPLVVPVGKKIRFLLTASDVIHAWWVPELGWKKDAIPGFINEAWAQINEPGIYRGQCAELCGRDHGFMPIVVKAVPEDEYRQWVASRQNLAAAELLDADRAWSNAELMARGEKVYAAQCAACHQPNGQGLPGAFPGIAGSPVATGDVAAHIDLVLNGRAGTAMAAYRDMLSDADTAAVITYQRQSWGNDAGAVQPTEIMAAR